MTAGLLSWMEDPSEVRGIRFSGDEEWTATRGEGARHYEVDPIV